MVPAIDQGTGQQPLGVNDPRQGAAQVEKTRLGKGQIGGVTVIVQADDPAMPAAIPPFQLAVAGPDVPVEGGADGTDIEDIDALEAPPAGVDTPEDLERVRRLLGA